MSSPLIDRLVSELKYPLLTADTFQAFVAAQPVSVLFFTEDPTSFPESQDVAVILPELIATFGTLLTPAVVAREFERTLQKQYGFGVWPTLVFLRRGEYLGAISRVQDWSDYLNQINSIINAEPTTPPAWRVPSNWQPKAEEQA